MKKLRFTIFFSIVLISSLFAQTDFHISNSNESGKPRVINMTDLGADPDDEQSMVRFLVMANEYDTEGLIVTTSCWKQTQSNTSMLDKILNAYGEVLNNLNVHANGYPTLEYLKSVSKMGQPGFGMAAVGNGKDSPGSNLIISVVDSEDPRPVWVNCWGGGNTLAQAIWKVQNTRTPEEVEKFVGKLRVYDILGQDDAGAWMTKNFPDLFYIRFLSVYSWQPSDSWVDTNVQNKGPLGEVYPDRKWAIEGDTPAFLYQYDNGLGDPEHADWGGWGGRCNIVKKLGVRGMTGGAVYNEAQYDPYYMFSDAPEGGNSIGRWRTAISNDFAARMIWSVTDNYQNANHIPFAVVNDDSTKQVLRINAEPGAKIELSADGSSDPDGNTIYFNWYFYRETGTYSGSVSIQNSTSKTPVVSIPSNADGTEIHIILEMRDSGNPPLYSYRRVVISAAYPTGLNNIQLNHSQFKMQTYPNPFSETARVKLDIPENGKVNADIFDVNGRLVENIYSGQMEKGPHILSWSPNPEMEGVFICKLNYNQHNYCCKLIRN